MRVLISGAGIAGNTLACFLGKAGIPVTLVEREASCLTRGHSIDIEGPAKKVLDSLGLLPELRKRNTGELGTVFETQRGREFAKFKMVEGQTGSPTSEFEILRGDLSAMLYDASRQYKGVTHILGKTIDQVTMHSDRSVAVKLNDGSTLEADVLVLSDGQWSKLRSACFPKDSVSFVDKIAYNGWATIPAVPSDTKMWRVFLADRRRALSLRPDPYGTTRAICITIPRNAEEKMALQSVARADPSSQKAVFRKIFSDAGWQSTRILDGFDTSDDFYFQAVYQVRMKKWSTGRIICLGDTAYCPTPFSGGGTTLAITGAYLLAGELSKLAPHAHPSAAFDAYEFIYRGHVDKVHDIPDWIPGAFMPETQFGVFLRQAVVWALAKLFAVPGVRRYFRDDDENDGFQLPQYDFAKEKQQ